MFQGAVELMVGTFVVMALLASVGIVGGLIIAKVRERRFLKAFKDEG